MAFGSLPARYRIIAIASVIVPASEVIRAAHLVPLIQPKYAIYRESSLCLDGLPSKDPKRKSMLTRLT